MRRSIDQGLRKAHWGALADFALLDDIQLSWLAVNSCDEAGVLAEFGLTKAEFARREAQLGGNLVRLIADNDTRSLKRVIEVVKFLQTNFKPVDARLEAVMQFFRRLTGERWTLAEIQTRLSARTGIWMRKKTLKRRCRDYGFPVKPDKVGRPRTKQSK